MRRAVRDTAERATRPRDDAFPESQGVKLHLDGAPGLRLNWHINSEPRPEIESYGLVTVPLSAVRLPSPVVLQLGNDRLPSTLCLWANRLRTGF